RGGALRYVLIAEIDQAEWLRFIALYPVAPDATLTLLDQNGIIIARTLHNERWVGRPPSATLARKSRELPAATYQGPGLEGQGFNGAHGRTAPWGWTVAPGVPAERIEAQIRTTLASVAAGGAAAAFLAIMLGLLLGRRIAEPITGLAELAGSLAREDA